MYTKILIKSNLKVLTGMHIGGSGAFAAIGAVNQPVIVDPRTRMPIIPGSSLKGKMRTLLAKSYAESLESIPKPDGDQTQVARLFGVGAGSGDNLSRAARLQFADAFVINEDEFKGIGLTEVKYENSIDRINSKANPRPLERVVSGVKFGVKIVYDMMCENELVEDMENVAKAMKLLQLDYLGGHGTRGSGRVSFEEFDITVEAGDDISQEKLNKIKEKFEAVENYELFRI